MLYKRNGRFVLSGVMPTKLDFPKAAHAGKNIRCDLLYHQNSWLKDVEKYMFTSEKQKRSKMPIS